MPAWITGRLFADGCSRWRLHLPPPVVPPVWLDPESDTLHPPAVHSAALEGRAVTGVTRLACM